MITASSVVEDFNGGETFALDVLSKKSFNASGELGPDDCVNVFCSLNFRIFRFKNSCLLGRIIACNRRK